MVLQLGHSVGFGDPEGSASFPVNRSPKPGDKSDHCWCGAIAMNLGSLLWLTYAVYIWNPIDDGGTMLHSSHVNHGASLRQQAPGARQSTGMFGGPRDPGDWATNLATNSLAQRLHNDSKAIRQMNQIDGSQLIPWKGTCTAHVRVCRKHYAETGALKPAFGSIRFSGST